MAEATEFAFTFKEVVEALLKKQGIHDGCWGLSVKFGIQASNIGPTTTDLFPAAIVPLMSIGLTKFETETTLSVDASKVNPKT